MMHHGGGSSKRSVFWGNVSTMGMLDKGTLSRAEKEKKTTVKTSRSSALYKFQETCDRLWSFEWFALNCDCAVALVVLGRKPYMFNQSSICQSRKIYWQVWSGKICRRQKGIKAVPVSRPISIDRLWTNLWILQFEQIWTDHSLIQ